MYANLKGFDKFCGHKNHCYKYFMCSFLISDAFPLLFTRTVMSFFTIMAFAAIPAVVAADPERFFVPPYMGVRGWLGARLDKRLGWKRITGIVEHAYRLTAPKRLAATLDER